ncbi:MAG TPA: hypothetical protein VIJ96_13190 [Acidothermaceae bacterium]
MTETNGIAAGNRDVDAPTRIEQPRIVYVIYSRDNLWDRELLLATNLYSAYA